MKRFTQYIIESSPQEFDVNEVITDEIIGLKLLNKAGYKSFDVFAGGSFHDYWEDVFFVKGTKGKYPITEAGFKKAGKAADKNASKSFQLSRDF